jgi:hypothetical protein
MEEESGFGRNLSTRNWPGSAGGSGIPSMLSNDKETTLELSRSTRATLSGRNPSHFGGGPAALVIPAFPLNA